ERNPELSPHVEREAQILQRQVHREADVVGAAEHELALRLVDEAGAGRGGDGMIGGGEVEAAPSISASPAATRWTKASMLVMTLITAPEPTGPIRKTRSHIDSMAGRWRSSRAASPPTSAVSRPSAARWTPPVTGHSRVSTP